MALTVPQLVWLIAAHCVIHGIVAILFVQTSFYVNYSRETNYFFVVLNIILICVGLCNLCNVFLRRPLCCRIFAAVFIILGIIYLISGILYFLNYCNFFANCELDALFFYTESECWVGPDAPLTIWHIGTIIIVGFGLLWIYYGFLLCKIAPKACCIPCPPPVCNKPRPPPCPPCPRPPGCQKIRWYHKLLKTNAHPPPSPPPPPPPPSKPGCPKAGPPAPPPAPAVPPACAPPAPPEPPAPPASAPSPPPPKKTPKFVLTLKPGKYCH